MNAPATAADPDAATRRVPEWATTPGRVRSLAVLAVGVEVGITRMRCAPPTLGAALLAGAVVLLRRRRP